MSNILFHPQLKLTEAYRLAREQGGMLVYSMGRVRIREAMRHNDQAAAAIEAENYDAALVHLRAAHEAIFGGESCAA